MSALAVLGCTVQITTGQTASSIQITTPPSGNKLVNNKGIYFGDIDVQLSGITMGNLSCPSGTITIKGTADSILDIDNSEDKKKAVQMGDNGSDTFEFTDSSTDNTFTLSVGIMITDAGQSDVIAT